MIDLGEIEIFDLGLDVGAYSMLEFILTKDEMGDTIPLERLDKLKAMIGRKIEKATGMPSEDFAMKVSKTLDRAMKDVEDSD